MNARTILLIQAISFILMLGTAEQLFTNIIPTIVFILSFVMFARCSIFINKNEKWLMKENREEASHYRNCR